MSRFGSSVTRRPDGVNPTILDDPLDAQGGNVMQELLVDFITPSRTFDGKLQLLEYVPTVLTGPPGSHPAS